MRHSVLVASVILVAGGLFAGPAPNAHADLAGKTIVLDAGHGASVDGPLTRQVPNGRGGTKDCQTSGTSTNDGFPEHTFNWDVVSRMRDELEAQGATVVLTRSDDTGPVPCVDERAAKANAAQPAVIVSIHGDGGPPSGRGFHVNYSSPPLNAAQTGVVTGLAPTMRNALVAAGLTPSNYIGSDGLYGRSDLAGLNLSGLPRGSGRTRQHAQCRRRREDVESAGSGRLRGCGREGHQRLPRRLGVMSARRHAGRT